MFTILNSTCKISSYMQIQLCNVSQVKLGFTFMPCGSYCTCAVILNNATSQ